MQKRIIQAGLAGMNQDVINPKVNTQYAYEIKNFRINSTGHSNGIELTSERGTKPIKLKYKGLYSYNIADIVDFDVEHNDLPIGQTAPESDYEVIGQCVLGDHLVLFIQGHHYEYNPDYGTTQIEPEWLEITRNCILRLDFVEEDQILHDVCFNVVPLFFGDLEFDRSHRIECIPYMESTDIQKVYWIDGINYPRVINIVREGGYTDFDEDEDPFSFYQLISSGSYNTIDVRKTYVGGLFYAGVIQYAFSFYNKNAQETPIIYTTPLNYISHSDRGEVANKQLGCAFDVTVKINIEDHDNFEYVRVYSIYRSSINGTPVVKVIKDTKLDNFTGYVQNPNYDPTDPNSQEYIPYDPSDQMQIEFYGIEFTDTNEQGYDFDTYRILVNSDHIKPNAIGYKDQKMFLGNYSSDFNIENPFIEGFDINNINIKWTTDQGKSFSLYDQNKTELYPYLNQMSHPSTGINYKNRDSNLIKGFKKGEFYKLGIQFQDKYGNWSSVFHVKTLQNTKYPNISSYTVELPYAITNTSQNPTQIKDIYDNLKQNFKDKYTKIRTVVSFPTLSERSILCQGIINPTVFNVGQRHNGTCYAQSSWFFRPFKPTGLNEFSTNTCFVKSDHLGPLANSVYENAEIQSMYFDDFYGTSQLQGIRVTKDYDDFESDDYNKYSSFYYVDQSIVTLNSPELQFDENIYNSDLQQYKIRKVGIVDFYNTAAKYNIIAESPLFLNSQVIDNIPTYTRSTNAALGFYDKPISIYNGSDDAFGKMLSSGPFWFDDIHNIFTWEEYVRSGWNDKSAQVPYIVYPWQRQYLNNWNQNKYEPFDSSHNDQDAGITLESETSKIIKKVLSNLRYCNSSYVNPGSETDLQFSQIKLYRSNENEFIRLKDQNEDDIVYQGNVDQLISCSSEYLGWRFEKQTNYSEFWFGFHRKQGYPIVTQSYNYYGNPDSSTSWLNSFDLLSEGWSSSIQSMQYFTPLNMRHFPISSDKNDSTPSDFSSDPILMRYKSSPHIVCKLDNALTNDIPGNTYGYLYLGEIYKDISNSSFVTDNSSFALQNRIWVPCGESEDLNSSNTHYLKWTEGDTFFQRYDCLKTYPYSNEDYQSVVEIASFMVETHVNLDGRYDENRGLIDNTFVNPTNFNLINPVYSQTNNFFQYNVLDEEDFKTIDFPTRFTWSLNKINGQDVDEWTRTNTAAFYDCDGDKGELTSLRRFNGQIYAFQDKGISRIKYNENVAINTNNGTPIELANSQSVNGVEYLSELVGSQNKWSNISTPNGIFFVDNNVAGLYRFGGKDSVLTKLTNNTLQRWMESNNDNSFVNSTCYDACMNEVLFTYGTNEQTLAYNCNFDSFTSFYDYKGVFGNIKNHTFNIVGNNIYFLREGDSYNKFYSSKTSPYWITFIANSDVNGFSQANTIYDNVWFNADVLHKTTTNNLNYNELIQDTDDIIPDFSKDRGWYETFNKIQVGNDYQFAENTNQTKNFDFIKKFRMWRVPVPRQNRTRMRNSWLRIKLENTNPSSDKMILRNIYVDSFS